MGAYGEGAVAGVREAGMSGEGRVMIGSGPREVEALLLTELRRHGDALREDPRLLAKPVRVVVPSRSLARHLSVALVRATGCGVAGVRIQTLHGLALEVHEAAGVRAGRGDELFGVLVRRAAREQRALHLALDALEDGYGAVVGAVSDLLDAGYDHATPSHRDAIGQALEESGLPRATQERVGALAQVAGHIGCQLAQRFPRWPFTHGEPHHGRVADGHRSRSGDSGAEDPARHTQQLG